MRILLAVHQAYTDPMSGATRSVRTLIEWLAEGGHDCRVLATSCFDSGAPADLDDHLDECGADRGLTTQRAGLPAIDFSRNGVPVTMLLTRHNQRDHFDEAETRQYLEVLEELLAGFAPDLVFTYGSHPVTLLILRRARRRGIRTLLTLRNHGYIDPDWFADVDHVLTTSPYLTETYRNQMGLYSTGIASPIDWAEVEAPEADRELVTFVNPSLHKGAALFARVVEVLTERRPDIRFLVVRSSTGDEVFARLPQLAPSAFRSVLSGPPVVRPAAFFALTRVLLVPSVFEEPFGRVAAEALINGIPPLVSDRGGLPQTVGEGGLVLPLPSWMTPTTTRLPSADEVAPWCDTLCRLWDDRELYARQSALARETGLCLYGEALQKRRYLDYFASLSSDPRRPLHR